MVSVLLLNACDLLTFKMTISVLMAGGSLNSLLNKWSSDFYWNVIYTDLRCSF